MFLSQVHSRTSSPLDAQDGTLFLLSAFFFRLTEFPPQALLILVM
jgi:hypothetical protein